VFLGDDNDSITASSFTSTVVMFDEIDLLNRALENFTGIETGEGDDIITSTGVIYNEGTIDTSDGNDSIISHGEFTNRGNVFLGDGNDSIIADTDFPNRAIENFNFIGTGDGNDIITSTGVIYNEGVINTGNGDDSIIVDGGIEGPGTGYGIYNNGGSINTGDGNDSIIANAGFESGPNSSGSVFLGNGEDHIKGFGSGDFYGGNGNDILELTPGSYTVGRWGRAVTFSKGSSLMLASEFEQLIAGGTTHLFASLTEGQTIVVA
jgi:hypothetical protein